MKQPATRKDVSSNTMGFFIFFFFSYLLRFFFHQDKTADFSLIASLPHLFSLRIAVGVFFDVGDSLRGCLCRINTLSVSLMNYERNVSLCVSSIHSPSLKNNTYKAKREMKLKNTHLCYCVFCRLGILIETNRNEHRYHQNNDENEAFKAACLPPCICVFLCVRATSGPE